MFAKIIISAFLALPLVAQLGFAAQCTKTYTVKEGDICDSISAANHVSTYQLAVLNQGVIDPGCTNLVPGETICLAAAGADCSNVYTVVAGDDCFGVEGKTGINATTLWQNNPQINADCSNLYVGEVLCVAGGAPPPPSPSGTAPAVVPPSTAVPANPKATAVHSPSSDDSLPYCDEL